MTSLLRVWPGVALALTFVDDAVAGPALAAAGAWLGAERGLPLAVAGFTALIGVLCATTALALRRGHDGPRDAVAAKLARLRQRRFVGRLVDLVGDDRPLATAVVATVVSPVLAVLVAGLAHPQQPLRRTVAVATTSYGLVFALAYTGAGSLLLG